ncbi:cysteine methyltransferase [Streptomyces sp. NPDC056309]|uniref:cysteine methyltransferase n=1 Tax=unclassified Streptomyces TaxID=2593676 RepID=UPI0035DFC5B9
MTSIEDVREAVIAIPVGAVASYGDIGNKIGAGSGQVGRAAHVGVGHAGVGELPDAGGDAVQLGEGQAPGPVRCPTGDEPAAAGEVG